MVTEHPVCPERMGRGAFQTLPHQIPTCRRRVPSQNPRWFFRSSSHLAWCSCGSSAADPSCASGHCSKPWFQVPSLGRCGRLRKSAWAPGRSSLCSDSRSQATKHAGSPPAATAVRIMGTVSAALWSVCFLPRGSSALLCGVQRMRRCTPLLVRGVI